jgi:hypothetical protein
MTLHWLLRFLDDSFLYVAEEVVLHVNIDSEIGSSICRTNDSVATQILGS